jgi:hypothetical protein
MLSGESTFRSAWQRLHLARAYHERVPALEAPTELRPMNPCRGFWWCENGSNVDKLPGGIGSTTAPALSSDATFSL